MIKADLALDREELVDARQRGQLAAARMAILERAARRTIGCMDIRLEWRCIASTLLRPQSALKT